MPMWPDYSGLRRAAWAHDFLGGSEPPHYGSRGIVVGMTPGEKRGGKKLGEKKLIKRIRRSAGRGKSVVTGIGDDSAVLRIPPGHEMLVTTDFTIEGVHFRRGWHPPELVGRRCLTRGLSDIAAMGGEPRAAFLSLAFAEDVSQKWIERFLKGLLNLAKEFKVPLAGGDTAQSAGGVQADIVVVGSVPKGEAVLRSGARAGEHIYVTGALGGSAAVLARLMESKPVRGRISATFVCRRGLRWVSGCGGVYWLRP